MKKLIEFFPVIYRRPLLLAAAGIIITLLFAIAVPFVKFDNDIKNFLAVDHPHRLNHDKFDAIFGSSEMIIIGIESKNAFSMQTLDYMQWLQGEIEKLNWNFPDNCISRELDLTTEESAKIIEAVNRNEVYGKDALKEFFANPERMSMEMGWDREFSSKVSRRVRGVSVERLLQLYRFPVYEIKSVLNTDYIKGEGDRFSVEKLIDREKINEASIAEMKEKIKSWVLYKDLLFSDDETLTGMSVRMNSIDINLRQKFIVAIDRIIRDNPREGLKVYLAGEPVVADQVSASMGDDLKVLLPFVLLVMVIILILLFRHYEGVVFPMIAMVVSVIWTVGTMTLLGIPMSMVSITVPTVLTAVASAYGIHFMTHYFMSKEDDRYESSMESMRVSGLGIIMAAITTVVGFGSLVTSDMTHIKNYGIITAIGVFYSLVITVTMIPAFLLLRKDKKPFLKFVNPEDGKGDMSSRFLSFIERHPGRHPVAVIVCAVAIICVSVYGMKSVELNMDSMDFFKAGSDVKVANNVINEKLAGTQVLNINIEAAEGKSVITPEVLSKIESFQKDVPVKFPEVGKTLAVTDFLKKMNREMHGGKDEFFRLPETEQMAREYLLLYSGDLDDIMSKGMDKLRIHLTMKHGTMAEQKLVREYAENYFGADFSEKNGVKVIPSGFMDLMIEANMLVFQGQLSSLGSSLLVVAILMFLIFRKMKLTLVSLVPLSVGIAMNFGIMGFLHIPLNAATALVASVSIGMGIDYSIHFINQYRNSLALTGDVDMAIRATYEGTGRAVLSNVVSVMAGFMVLLFSKFPVVQQCGGLIAFTVTTTGFAAIIIIPAAFKVLNHFEKKKAGKIK